MHKTARTAVFIAVMLLTSCFSSSPSGSVSPAPFPPTAVTRSTPLTVLWPAYAHWLRVIRAGASADDLLRVAGEPDRIQTYRNGQVYEYWPNAARDVFVNATLVDGVVQLVSIVAWPGTSLGPAADVMVGRQAELILYEDYLGRDDAVYAFPAEGFAIGVEGDMVTVVQYFLPIDETSYSNQWGSRHPREVLFPSRLDVLFDLLAARSVDIGQTRESVESALGENPLPNEGCCWGWYSVGSEDRIWNFEIAALYSDQTVLAIDMHITDDQMTLADIVREFGVPDVVLGNASDPRSQAALLTLVYLSRGRQFTVGGVLLGSEGQFGGEGPVWSAAFLGYRSAEEYLEDPCASSLRTPWGFRGQPIPWEMVNPFPQQSAPLPSSP